MATYNVNPEANKIIKEYAESIGVDAEAALNRLINTAASRRKALKKYAGSTAPKAPKAKAEKKAKAPKGTSLAKKKAAPKAKKAKASKGVAIKIVTGSAPEAAAL